MTTNYDINNVDIDDSPYNFSSYINANDGNYTNISVLNITARKAVIFGQNYFTGAVSYASIGDLGGAFNEALAINVPKIDIDPVDIIAALPTAAISSNTIITQDYIRGNYDLAENNQNIVSSICKSYYGIKNNSNYVITTDGKLLEIGRSRRFNTSVPTIFSESQWKQASTGSSFIAAIQSNGTLWAWGNNANGQLGLSDTTERSSPVQVGALSVWTQVSSEQQSSLAIQSNGTLWSWGRNDYGQLGLSNITTRSSPVQVGALSIWSQIFSGGQHTLALQSNGTLWGWGYNVYGQLGLSDAVNKYSPIQVGTLSNWSRISGGSIHTVAIQSDGTLWSWGYNSNGQLGLSDITNRSSPIQVGALLWKEISAGSAHTLAIQSNGTLWAWGRNNGRQLGITNAGLDESSPNQVGSLSTWTKVSAGYFSSLGLQSDGTLWYWGVNSFGIQGNNTIAGGGYSTPVQVGTLSKWSQINCFQSSTTSALAIQSDGTLWSWGNNANGQLGFDSVSYRSSASQVSSSSSWSKLPGGSQASAWSLAIDNSQTLYGFGDNTGWIQNPGQAATYYGNSISYGIGDGQLIALPLPLSSNVFSVSSGTQCASFIKTDGTLWAWGSNTSGQIGISNRGSNIFYPTAALIATPEKTPFVLNFSSIRIGCSHMTGLKSDGTLWSWGSNSSGELAVSDAVARSSPVQVGTSSTWSQVSCGYAYVLALQTDGTLWSWGSAAGGTLGNNTTVGNKSTPIQIGALLWKEISAGGRIGAIGGVHALAIQSNGTLYSWGYNILGQLGLGNTTDRSSPVQVGTLSDWSKVSSGQLFSLALKTNNTLWSWGYNGQGQLGSSNTTDRSSPVQVGSLSTWSQIRTGISHALALQSDGTLWAWGANSQGQLGLGDRTARSSPTKVGNLSTWTQIEAGYTHTLGLLTNGNLYVWGANTWGELGVGDLTNRSSPIQVGALSVWTKISAGFGLSLAQTGLGSTADVYIWGAATITGTSNAKDATGAHAKDVLAYYTPVQVGSFSDWTQVIHGGNHTLGLRAGGQLYSWGYNGFGQLGISNITNRSSPVQVGSQTDWSMVAAGNFFSAATKNNGTLWAWGNNSFGQLGQGDYTHRSSPVQVGTVSQYVSVYAMSNTLLANLF